jgi:hypothetical protein
MKKRVLSLATIFAVMVVMLMPAPVMAASSGGNLLSNVKCYNYDTGTKKYRLYSETDYVYEKGYPTEVSTTNYAVGDLDYSKVKYKMSKGLPKTAKHYNEINIKDENWTYTKGLRTKVVRKLAFYRIKWTETFKYSKGFVTSYKNEYYSKDPGSAAITSTYTCSYKYVMSKGLPKTMESTCVDSDDPTDIHKNIVSYNNKGLITDVQRINSDGQAEKVKMIKYTVKKGVVTQAVVYNNYDSGLMVPETKYVFTYTNSKAGKARFANMINATVDAYNVDEGSYNWF